MIQTRLLDNGDTRYTVRVGNGGRQRTFTRLKDARAFETEARRDLDRVRAGLPIVRRAVSYDDLCVLFLHTYSSPSKDWTERMLAHSRKRFGKELVGSIRPEEIATWLADLNYSTKTKKHILERMRVVLTMGVEWGYLTKSPARPTAVKGVSGRRLEPIQPFESWAEVVSVADALETPTEQALVKFLCASGLRCPSEWQRLRWKDVDLDAREVRVSGTKSNAAPRTVPLSNLAASSLAPLDASPRKLIFDGIDYPNWRRFEWRTALNEAGLAQRPPYQMRHTFATLALSAGVPLDVVANWLGHADLAVTRSFYAKYIRPTTERYAALLDTLEEQ